MVEPDDVKSEDQPDKPKDTVGWPDLAAIGIGCLVVVIFFGAIVVVSVMRGQ